MFKYSEKFVADLLFNENRIRIGTLNGFRDMESKQGISDPLEGSYEDHVLINGTEKDYFNNQIFKDSTSHLAKIHPSCRGVKFINCSSTTKIISPNYLIFCCSDKKSRTVMSQFDGADTCFTIHKPNTFFTLITWALNQKFKHSVNFLGVHNVSYQKYRRERTAYTLNNMHPALAKTDFFEHQHELRAIWELPQNLITKPFYDLQIVGLRKSCRLTNL